MKKCNYYVIFFMILIILTGCKHNEPQQSLNNEPITNEVTPTQSIPAEPTESVENTRGKKQALMVYMVGSNLESEEGMGSKDIEEMQKSLFDEEKFSVYLCTGGADYWMLEGIPDNQCCVSQVKRKGLEQVSLLKNKNMGEAATLTEFIDTVYDVAEADSYSIIFWNHGGGAVLGFGADENYDYDMLSLQELRKGLGDTKFYSDGNKFAWSGFDACLMGMLEVSNVMSDFADYMIASEEIESQYGWNYKCLREVSKNHDSNSYVAEAILDSYEDYMHDSFKYTPDYTLACFDLSMIEPVNLALEKFVNVAKTQLNEQGYSSIVKQRCHVRTFGQTSNEGFYDTIDLYDLAERFSDLYPEETQSLKEAISNMITHEVTNLKHAHGVAIYFPYENKEYAREWVDEYRKIGLNPNYTDFISKFTDILTGEPLYDLDVSQTVPQKEEKTEENYYIQLTKEQQEHFAYAKFSVWEKEEDSDSYICWLSSSDVTVEESGKISSGFLGYRFFISNAKGESLACCALQTENTEEYQKFVIPVIINPNMVEGVQVGYIHVNVDQNLEHLQVLGVYYDCDTDSILSPNKNVLTLKVGDIVCPFYFAREIKKDENGTILPFEEWKQTSGIGSSLTVDDEFMLTYEIPEEKYDYAVLFSIMDTQGNAIYTNPVSIENKTGK